jgi:mRNA interferase MazF
MICEPLDVIAVPFPFMERPAVKRRPALVISTTAFNEANGHSIMAMITAALLDRWPSDYQLTDPRSAGLNVDCFVRWKVFILPNSMVVKKIGELTGKDRSAILPLARQVFV